MATAALPLEEPPAWPCAKCTFLNPPANTICSACAMRPRPAAAGTAYAAWQQQGKPGSRYEVDLRRLKAHTDELPYYDPSLVGVAEAMHACRRCFESGHLPLQEKAISWTKTCLRHMVSRLVDLSGLDEDTYPELATTAPHLRVPFEAVLLQSMWVIKNVVDRPSHDLDDGTVEWPDIANWPQFTWEDGKDGSWLEALRMLLSPSSMAYVPSLTPAVECPKAVRDCVDPVRIKCSRPAPIYRPNKLYANVEKTFRECGLANVLGNVLDGGAFDSMTAADKLDHVHLHHCHLAILVRDHCALGANNAAKVAKLQTGVARWLRDRLLAAGDDLVACNFVQLRGAIVTHPGTACQEHVISEDEVLDVMFQLLRLETFVELAVEMRQRASPYHQRAARKLDLRLKRHPTAARAAAAARPHAPPSADASFFAQPGGTPVPAISVCVTPRATPVPTKSLRALDILRSRLLKPGLCSTPDLRLAAKLSCVSKHLDSRTRSRCRAVLEQESQSTLAVAPSTLAFVGPGSIWEFMMKMALLPASIGLTQEMQTNLGNLGRSPFTGSHWSAGIPGGDETWRMDRPLTSWYGIEVNGGIGALSVSFSGSDRLLVGDEMITALADHSLLRLGTLDLSSCQHFVSEVGLEALAKCPVLRELALTFSTYFPASSRPIKVAPSLQKLSITDCRMRGGDMKSILSSCLKTTSKSGLTELNLSRTRYLPHDMQQGAECVLGGLPTSLTKLVLRGCDWMRDYFLQELTVRCGALRDLDIRGNERVTDVGLKSLPLCPALEIVRLRGCPKLTVAGLAMLAEAAPGLEICLRAGDDHGRAAWAPLPRLGSRTYSWQQAGGGGPGPSVGLGSA